MLKQLVVATALTCGAAVAFAQSPPSPSPSPTQMPRNNTAAAPAVESTGDFNKTGEMAGSAIIGAKVHDAKKETIGSIQDLYLDDSAKVKVVIVSVGGFLGVGAKDVRREVGGHQVRQGRQVARPHHRPDQGRAEGDA